MIIHESDIEANFVTIVLANGYAICSVYGDDDKDSGIAWLANVKVHPIFRGQGYGNQLIKQALTWPANVGMRKCNWRPCPDGVLIGINGAVSLS